MYHEEIERIAKASEDKVHFLKKNPLGYFVSSLFGGMFVGFGIIVALTIGGVLNSVEFPVARLVMAISFGSALSMVVMAGAELFTGNNFIMSVGILCKKTTIKDTVFLWIICWIGNLVGSILLGVLFHYAGLNTGVVGEAFASTAEMKVLLDPMALLLRGILCNFLVCIAVWCTYRCKSESAKLIMIAWCVFILFIAGFEHSIANMSVFTIAQLSSMANGFHLGGGIYNLLFVTIGNMIGGILFVGIPYFIIAKRKKISNYDKKE